MAAKKMMILVAAMAAMVVLSHASLEDSNQMSGQCRRQLRGQWPDMCEEYLMEKMSYSHGRRYGRNQGMHFNQCCVQLGKMGSSTCQCQAMEMMIDQMMSTQTTGMSRRLMDMAMELPMMCGTMDHPCHMSYTI